MNVTTQRRFLELIAGGLLASTVGVGVWALRDIDASDSTALNLQSLDQPEYSIPAAPEARQHNDQVLTTSLRGPLYDPPPPAPAPPTKTAPTPIAAPTPTPPPALNLTLVGTLKNNDRGFAILEDSTSKFDVKGVGEALELTPAGVTIKNIQAGQVTVMFQGRESVLTIEASKSKPDGADARATRKRAR
jgi:Type II secretion system protein C